MIKKVIYGFMTIVLLLFSGLPVQSQPSGELRIGLPTLYDQTLHPIWETTYHKNYMEPMYDYLVGVDKDGKFDPKQGIATKWEMASNYLSWIMSWPTSMLLASVPPMDCLHWARRYPFGKWVKVLAPSGGNILGKNR